MTHTIGEHPRVRGENTTVLIGRWSAIGTSPRARGKQDVMDDLRFGYRNIPACAGKTTLPLIIVVGGAEHPRVRGENDRFFAMNIDIVGTSPRARGKPQGVPGGFNEIRNIPACAGKTC